MGNSKKANERVDFMSNANFLVKNRECELAYQELAKYKDTVISKELYKSWLKKFHHLYNSLELVFKHAYSYISNSFIKEFYFLYNEMDILYKCLLKEAVMKKAIGEYHKINTENEMAILKWLVKYEKTGSPSTLFVYEDIDLAHPENNEYFKVDILKIKTSDFESVAKFEFLFSEHYWEMLHKHTTFSDEDNIQLLKKDNEMTDYVFSLTYHLNKRGLIKG